MKAQFSVELFLAMGLFMLVLFWFYNYAQFLQSQNVLYGPQKNLLNQVATLAGEAYSTGTTITFTLPCLTLGGAPSTFWVYGGGTDDSDVISEGGKAIAVYVQLAGGKQSVVTLFPVGSYISGTSSPIAFTCDEERGDSGKIKFEAATIGSAPGVKGVKITKSVT